MSNTEKCPYFGTLATKTSIDEWWPNRLDLTSLNENSPLKNPMDPEYDYSVQFKSLNLDSVVKDLTFLMTDSQDWWPADFGNYGPFFIRMSWHSAGTYRISDGRGGAGNGAQRFAPLNSWPDNVNLDKARRLLWPIKQKYGLKLSWADLIVLAGTVALQSMGLAICGFAGGRTDTWSLEDLNWGSEKKWLDDKRYTGDHELANPLAAVQMGLIYVNPEGPNGIPDPLAAAGDIRETFLRMSMNDEETVALIAGGHTFGKTHGAANPISFMGPAPEAASLEEQGLGWKNSFGSGSANNTISSGIEGSWTRHPTKWSSDYLDNLLNFEWELTVSPAGAHQWTPKDVSVRTVPDAHEANKKHLPIMLTTDLALKYDPVYLKISKHYQKNNIQLADEFSKAWFKLTHRDMGPITRYLGPLVPSQQFIWQDPIPLKNNILLDAKDIINLKKRILDSPLTVSQLVRTAWASASTYRNSDKRGGANGGRINLLPQKNWQINSPDELKTILNIFNTIKNDFHNEHTINKNISIADLIIFGGGVAIEKCVENAGQFFSVPFMQGRNDAFQEDTDIESFKFLEPKTDGFRNFLGSCREYSACERLVDRANQLTLTAPEMTVLIGGLRVLKANFEESSVGLFSEKIETLSNDFFINLLDMQIVWTKSSNTKNFEGRDRKTGILRWIGSDIDLIFGSSSELRAISEVYASDDAQIKFIKDFISAWTKVMNLDRFDL